MKKLAFFLFLFAIPFCSFSQTLTIGNIPLTTDGDPLQPDSTNWNAAAYSNLNWPVTTNGVVTVKVKNSSAAASISATILQTLGNTVSASDDLIIDGNGNTQIQMNADVVEGSTSGRSITLTNTGKVHFNTGVFTSSGSFGPITLVIGEDAMGSTGVTTLEFDKEPSLNGGIYRIAAGTIIDDVGITFPATTSNYSRLKFTTWSSSSTGTPTFETYVGNDGDRMISSPTTNGFTNISAVNTSGSSVTVTKSNLYAYDASSGAWQTSGVSLTSAGEGYFGFVGSGTNTTGTFLASSPAIISVDGTPNSSFTYSLDYSTSVATGGSGNGWNLLANPFPAPMNWTTVSTLTDVNNAIYIWDPVNELYKYYVSGVTAPSGTYAGSAISGQIAPMQSFWVQATSSSAAISQVTSASNTSMKISPSVYKTLPDNLIITIVDQNDTTNYDSFWLKNVASTSLDFEGAEDAWKYKNPNKLNVYTKDSLNEGIAINSIDLGIQQYIPFTLETTDNPSYSIMLEEVIQTPNAYQVYLFDIAENDTYDLSAGTASLSLDTNTVYDNRFALFVTSTSTVGIVDAPALDWKTSVNESGIHVTAPYEGITYTLMDVSGKRLATGNFNYDTTIPVRTSGVKILTIHCGEGIATTKINIIK